MWLRPLSVIEYVMQRAENLKSIGALEIYMGVRKPDDWHIPYINRLIRLCGKYGLPFLYTDGNRNDIDFPAVIKREDYMATIRNMRIMLYCPINRIMRIPLIPVTAPYLAHGRKAL